jgi:hypothetical protein
MSEMPKELKQKRDELAVIYSYSQWDTNLRQNLDRTQTDYLKGFNACYEEMQEKLDLAIAALELNHTKWGSGDLCFSECKVTCEALKQIKEQE